MTRARDLADSADKDIVGTLNVDGLTVDTTSSPAITLQETTGTYGYKIHTAISSSTDYGLRLRTLANKELATFNSNGDISFYNPAGTSAQMTWKASDERLGIGTSSPVATISVNGEGSQGLSAWFGKDDSFVDNASYHYADARVGISGRDSAGIDRGAGIEFTSRNNGNSNWLHGYLVHDRGGNLTFGTGGAGTSPSSEAMRLDSSGNLLVGGTNATTDLKIQGNYQYVNNAPFSLSFQNNHTGGSILGSISSYLDGAVNSGALLFNTASSGSNTEAMRLDSSGTLITKGAAVFNDTGASTGDFRVESDSNGSMFFVDASQNTVNINNSAAYASNTFLVNQTSDARGIALAHTARGNARLELQLSGVNNEGATFYHNNHTDRKQLFHMSRTNVVVNEEGLDMDFRVKTNSFADAFVVSDNTVKIATGTNGGAGGWTFYPTGSGGMPYVVQNKTAVGSTRAWAWQVNGTTTGAIDWTSSGTTYSTTSDRRLKENIEPIADGTAKLMAMKPVTHTWLADPEADAVHGFIAQEMQEIVPEAVSGEPDGEEMMSMDYGRITPVLVAALQEATNEIKALKQRVSELEAI